MFTVTLVHCQLPRICEFCFVDVEVLKICAYDMFYYYYNTCSHGACLSHVHYFYIVYVYFIVNIIIYL